MQSKKVSLEEIFLELTDSENQKEDSVKSQDGEEGEEKNDSDL